MYSKETAREIHEALASHSIGHSTRLSRAVRSGALTTPQIELETVTVRLSGGRYMVAYLCAHARRIIWYEPLSSEL